MRVKIWLKVESFATFFTIKMFQFFMNSFDVFHKAVLIVKLKFADMTFVGFQFLVLAFYMSVQTRAMSEILRTLVTFVRSQTCVNLADVTFEVVLVPKICTAGFTCKRFRTLMDCFDVPMERKKQKTRLQKSLIVSI